MISRIRSRACCIAWREGQRARKRECRDRGVLPRTQRWWKPRKSTPSPPSARCTIRVLAVLSSRPSSARIAASAASAASASCAVSAHRQQIVRVAHQHPVSARLPTAGRAGAGRRCTGTGEITPPCGVPVSLRVTAPVLHHPGAQHRAQELEDVAVADPLLDRRHQPSAESRRRKTRHTAHLDGFPADGASRAARVMRGRAARLS